MHHDLFCLGGRQKNLLIQKPAVLTLRRCLFLLSLSYPTTPCASPSPHSLCLPPPRLPCASKRGSLPTHVRQSAPLFSSFITIFIQHTACALICISQADLGNCTASDTLCLCNDTQFVDSVAQCISANCTGNDLTDAEETAQAVCRTVVCILFLF